jgi:hypothetical protein
MKTSEDLKRQIRELNARNSQILGKLQRTSSPIVTSALASLIQENEDEKHRLQKRLLKGNFA